MTKLITIMVAAAFAGHSFHAVASDESPKERKIRTKVMDTQPTLKADKKIEATVKAGKDSEMKDKDGGKLMIPPKSDPRIK
jgi:hypothetical protein